MRFYGIRSGRNNPARLIARSYMYNWSKSGYVKPTKQKSSDCGYKELAEDLRTDKNGTFSFLVVCFVIALICMMFYSFSVDKAASKAAEERLLRKYGVGQSNPIEYRVDM